MDYALSSNSMNQVSIVVPDGPARRHCVNIAITDDNISQEGDESVILSFTDLPSGVIEGNVPESTVTITDNDSELSYRDVYILYFSL